ncbi:hypothetical protein QSJ19_00905 [Gordonia sp. ABSL11-1]|uniref:hypothetical protein n=1 Tax=Gordonia sp. ABSL11-1 TaxID=3053924 RepID=UPI0025734AAC|nr:hypothetical protein [Gordonia sp. ABSL11-1]MDL9944160.1 hypothetical protein [Gordonia sp. ABSL11-1]
MDAADEGFKPPYMSFQTFWNFIDELGSKPLPPRIDRSLMGSKSGSDQANLTASFTAFGLIDANSNVLPLLQKLAEGGEEERKALLATMVREYYSEPMAVSERHGTSKDLRDTFVSSYPGITSADTRRKCITFYLHAARTAGLELSAHFPSTRSGSGAPGASKPRKSSTRRKPPSDQDSGGEDARGRTPQSEGDTYTVALASGGKVSVVVDVNLFALTTEDRNFVIDLVDKLKGYETPGSDSDDSEEVSP